MTMGGFEAVSHLKGSFLDHIRLWARATSPSLFSPSGLQTLGPPYQLTPLAVAADDKVDADALQANTRLWKCLFTASLC